MELVALQVSLGTLWGGKSVLDCADGFIGVHSI